MPSDGSMLGSRPTNFFGTLQRPSRAARRRLPSHRLGGVGAGALTAVALGLAAKAAEAGSAFSERRAGTFPRRWRSVRPHCACCRVIKEQGRRLPDEPGQGEPGVPGSRARPPNPPRSRTWEKHPQLGISNLSLRARHRNLSPRFPG